MNSHHQPSSSGSRRLERRSPTLHQVSRRPKPSGAAPEGCGGPEGDRRQICKLQGEKMSAVSSRCRGNQQQRARGQRGARLTELQWDGHAFILWLPAPRRRFLLASRRRPRSGPGRPSPGGLGGGALAGGGGVFPRTLEQAQQPVCAGAPQPRGGDLLT